MGRCRGICLAALLLALSSVFLFGGDRGYFYGYQHYPIGDWNTARWMSLVANFSFSRGLLYESVTRRRNGELRYAFYGRFPPGGVALLKLATAPFEGNLARQLFAARMVMLAFFCAAAVLAYLSLVRLCGERTIALAATLWAFSSYHMMGYKDVVNGEGNLDLFAVLLVFHGVVLYVQEGRWRGLLARIAVALLLGWHVYALLAPFVAWGLAVALHRAWRNGRPGRGPGGLRGRLKGGVNTARRLAAAVLHSGHLRVGVFALAVGLGALAYNAAQEYAAFDGARPVRELPVVRSMLRRTGLDEHYDAVWAQDGAVTRFFKWQLHRIGLMLLPHAVSGRSELLRLEEHDWEALGATTFAPLGAIGCCACLGALCMVRRGRMPLAILAVSGVIWALALRNNTMVSNHDYEAPHYVGIPLVLVALALVALRNVLGRHGGSAVAAAAALAAGLFVLSSWTMAEARAAPHGAAAQRAAFAEFDAMRPLVRGRDVLNAATGEEAFETLDQAHTFLGYQLAGAILHQGDDLRAIARLEADGCCDLVLSRRRLALPSLYTPENRHWFLYDAGGVADAIERARRRDFHALRGGERLAAARYDVYLRPRGRAGAVDELLYIRAPCAREDTEGVFVTRFRSGERSLRRRLLAHREGRRFAFDGLRIGPACVLVVAPPPGAAQVTVRQLDAGERERWRAAVRLDLVRLRGDREALRRRAPMARGAFDVYWRRGTLTYLRAPCALDDLRDRFFLHVVPAPAEALPRQRRDAGSTNLDFDFGEHGARIDGACVATVPLPYDAAQVYTGQFTSSGQRWALRFEVG